RLLTVTSTTPAPANVAAGSLPAPIAPGGTSRTPPPRSTIRSPRLPTAAASAGRHSSVTLRPASARQPPAWQPMLPAPATAIFVSSPIMPVLRANPDGDIHIRAGQCRAAGNAMPVLVQYPTPYPSPDRKSTRLNSSHVK